MANVARENIMKRIKQALAKPVPVPFPASEGQDSVFNPSKKELEVEFAEKFTGLLGRFSYCENEIELVAQLNALIAKQQLGSTNCQMPAFQVTITMMQLPIPMQPLQDVRN